MSDRRRRRKNRTSSKASEAPSEPKKEEEPKNEIKLDDKIEEKEEEPEIKPEEIPLIPNSLKMDILLSTASMQHQNGLRAGDYLRYAHFCRKKIQKLRKMNHLSQGKRKFQKVEITPQLVKDNKVFMILILLKQQFPRSHLIFFASILSLLILNTINVLIGRSLDLLLYQNY